MQMMCPFMGCYTKMIPHWVLITQRSLGDMESYQPAGKVFLTLHSVVALFFRPQNSHDLDEYKSI